MNYFFHYSLHWPCYIILHTHTRHKTSLQPYLYVPSTEPSLHLFHSEGDLKKINNLQEIYKVLNVITLNVYKNSNLPRAFKQECTPPSPYAWHISLFQKKQLLIQCQKYNCAFYLQKIELRSEDSPLKSQNPPPEQCTGHTESQRLIVWTILFGY